MIHTFGREYRISKREIDEYYPEEVVVMLRFLAFENHDKDLRKHLDYYMHNIDSIMIQHSDPNKVRDSYRQKIQELQRTEIKIVDTHDDDLPDKSRISALKDEFRKHHK